MRHLVTDNEERFEFDTVSELLKFVQTKPIHGTASLANRPYFAGVATFEEAVGLALNGWPEGIAQIEAARRAIPGLTSPESFLPLPVIREEGDEVLVDRWLDGESDHWMTYEESRKATRGRIIRVEVNIAVSAGVGKSTITQRGAVVLAFVDALEAAGYRVELAAVAAQTITHKGRGGYRFNYAFPVKRAEDSLDLDRLAFLLMHPATVRMLGFRLMEIADCGKNLCGQSYGTPCEVLDSELDPETIHFKSLKLATVEGAIAQARKVMESLSEAESA